MLRTLTVLAFALVAGAAQAAKPEIELRAGVLDFGPSGSSTYTGIGVRHRFNDTWAVSGDYTTTITDGSTSVDSSLMQIGGYVELGHLGEDWRASVKLGAVHSEAEIGAFDTSETAPAFGAEFIWKFIGLSWTHTELNGNSISATSVIFRF